MPTANRLTPSFKLDFSKHFATVLPSDLEKVFDPSHPLADETGHFQGSNVNLMIEIADAREAQRSYEANLKMFDQTRQMSSGLMDLLRK